MLSNAKKKSHRRTLSDSVATRGRPPLPLPAAYQGRFVVPNPAHPGEDPASDRTFGNKAGGPAAPRASPGPPKRRGQPSLLDADAMTSSKNSLRAKASPRLAGGIRRVDSQGSQCSIATNDKSPPARDANEGLFRGTRSSTPRSFYGPRDPVANAATPPKDANDNDPSPPFRVTSTSTPRSFYGSVSEGKRKNATATSNPGANGERNDGSINARLGNIAPGMNVNKLDGNIDGGDYTTPLLPDLDRARIAGDGGQDCDAFDYTGLIQRFELFRRVIEHEDDLLNQRVAWTLLAESFLMAAFITAKTNDNTDRYFLYVTATVGLGTVLVTLPALVAAGWNIEVQQRIYFEGLPSDAICRALHGHDRDRGWRTTLKVSHSSHLLPNMAFRSRYGIPIVVVVVLLSAVQVVGWCFLLVALAVVGGTDDGAALEESDLPPRQP